MKKLAHEKKYKSLEYELDNVRYGEFIGLNKGMLENVLFER